MVICLLFFQVTPVVAAEQAEDQPKEPEIHISAEDQQVIAHMELLQQMDMLKDLNLLTGEDEKK